jgi:hypothetical protein
LLSVFPEAFIKSAIDPKHLTVTVLIILEEIPTIFVPVRPFVNPIAVLLVIKILSLIGVTFDFLVSRPHSFPTPKSFLEVAFEHSSVFPEVLAVPFRFAVQIVADVDIAISEMLSSFSILEAIIELTLEPIAVDPDVHSPAFCSSHLPLSVVGVAFDSLPKTFTILYTIGPFTIVKFTVGPIKLASSIGLTVCIGASKLRSLREIFPAFAVFLIIGEGAFVDAVIIVEHDT